MQHDIKISAVIITFNEEKHIAKCIDALLVVADEIIVVDSFSTDDTESICRSKGVRFIQNKFEGHIEQKNYAMMQATSDYVLSVDADEVLSEGLQSFIAKEKSSLSYDAYRFNRLNNYCGQWIKHCGWYPDRKIRLWNRTKGRWGGDNPHDKVQMAEEATMQSVSEDILHYTFSSVGEHISQIHYFTTISARSAYDNGKRTNLLKIGFSPFFKFVRCYFLQLGFLDGYYGLVICINNGYAKFVEHLKMREIHKGKSI